MLYTRAQKRTMQMEEIHELLKHSTAGERAWVIRFLRSRQKYRDCARKGDGDTMPPLPPIPEEDDED